MSIYGKALTVVIVIMITLLVLGEPMPPWAAAVLYFSAASAMGTRA